MAFMSARNGTRSQLALRPRPVLEWAWIPVAVAVKVDVGAVAAHGHHAGRLHDQDGGHVPGELRALRDRLRAALGGLLVRGEEERHRHVLRHDTRRHDRGRDGTLHVGGAEADEEAALDAAAPRIVLPAGLRDGVHVAGEREAATGRSATRDQRPLRHAGRIRVVEPLDLEARQLPLDPVGDRDIGHEAAAVDAHEIAGEVGDGA